MERLRVNAFLKIKAGKLEEFKNLVNQLVAVVKEKDTDTHVYDWYLNEATRECTVIEEYTNSAGLMTHMANGAHILPAMMEIIDLSLEIYGTPSEEVNKALDGMPLKVYPYFAGL
jgi:quinol monooxygenase YgiN